MYFQSYGAMSIIKVKAYWFHVRERGVFGAIFGTLISFGVYFAFDWGGAIVAMTKANPMATAAGCKICFADFRAGGPTVDATWAVFFIPAAILIFWVLLDWWLIKDTPEEAGFPHLDTCDASSGQMHVEFSVLDLLKKIFASPLMLLIACVELTSGVFRYSMTQWYPVFATEVKQPGAEFFSQHWGWLLCLFGIVGGFCGRNHFRQAVPVAPRAARRAAVRLRPAGGICDGVVAVFAAGRSSAGRRCCIVMASIGITSLMSGTAATDFGGRKATATCSGIVDGFAYLGSGLQSFSLGFIITRGGWHWWPVFLIPFALLGGGVAL